MPSSLFSTVRILLLTAFCASPIFAQEWNRFRGPNGSGIGEVKGLPAEFMKSDYEWEIELPGIGHSSPVVWDGKIFLTIVGTSGKDRRIQCYDSTSGELVWEWTDPLVSHHQHRFNAFASSTPTVDADGVYVVWANGEKTQALSLDHSGEVRWRREWDQFTSDHGHAASPVIIGGNLIFHTDSKDLKKSQVISLDRATGESNWELLRESPASDEKHLTSYSTPVEVDAGGLKTIAVVQTNDGWKGLDPKDGSVKWAFDGDYGFRSVGSIIEGDGTLFASFGSGGNGKQSTALKPNSTATPKLVYSLGKGDGLSYVPTPLFYEGLLYLWGDGGILTCRDAATGERIYEERVTGNFFSSPVITDGKIYCASKDGEMICVATGREFKIHGRRPVDGGVNATPAIANGRLIVRTDTHLFSIKAK